MKLDITRFSGGSHNYICYQIDEYLVGKMKDIELNDLIKDISKLAHDLEWADSGDMEDEDYFESVKAFKEKWFKKNRGERLKNYIDEEITKTKEELTRLINK